MNRKIKTALISVSDKKNLKPILSILKNLDVFVTVSNSTAHFAGALGIPTILILSLIHI